MLGWQENSKRMGKLSVLLGGLCSRNFIQCVGNGLTQYVWEMQLTSLHKIYVCVFECVAQNSINEHISTVMKVIDTLQTKYLDTP